MHSTTTANHQNKSRQKYNQDTVIDRFSERLSQLEHINKSILLNNITLLDSKVSTHKSEIFDIVADDLRTDKWRLYHWYYETFLRSIQGCITKNDHEMMKDEIYDAITHKKALDKDMQQSLKQRLSKEYHRSTFSIAFNNIKRQVLRETPSLNEFLDNSEGIVIDDKPKKKTKERTQVMQKLGDFFPEKKTVITEHYTEHQRQKSNLAQDASQLLSFMLSAQVHKDDFQDFTYDKFEEQ